MYAERLPLSRRARLVRLLSPFGWCWYCGDGPTRLPARYVWDTPARKGIRTYIGHNLEFLDRRLACEFCRWFNEAHAEEDE